MRTDTIAALVCWNNHGKQVSEDRIRELKEALNKANGMLQIERGAHEEACRQLEEEKHTHHTELAKASETINALRQELNSIKQDRDFFIAQRDKWSEEYQKAVKDEARVKRFNDQLIDRIKDLEAQNAKLTDERDRLRKFRELYTLDGEQFNTNVYLHSAYEQAWKDAGAM